MSTKGKIKHTRRHRGSTRTQVQGTRTHGARMQGTCTRKQRALPTSALSTSLQEAVCKHQGSAGVWIWAILVSQPCAMVHLPWRHVERLPFCRLFDHTGRLRCSSDHASLPNACCGCRVGGDVVSVRASLPVHSRRAAIPARRSCRLQGVCAA